MRLFKNLLDGKSVKAVTLVGYGDFDVPVETRLEESQALGKTIDGSRTEHYCEAWLTLEDDGLDLDEGTPDVAVEIERRVVGHLPVHLAKAYATWLVEQGEPMHARCVAVVDVPATAEDMPKIRLDLAWPPQIVRERNPPVPILRL